MAFNIVKNNMEINKSLLNKLISNGDVVLDCTVGNGHDTVRLADLVGDEGRVYGFDIQEEALKRAEERLISENLIDRVTLIKDGHENVDKHVTEEVNLAIYNLGYLPGGNKGLTTRKETTIESIEKVLKLLKPGGIISLMVYIGHDKGFEANGVYEYIKNLDQKKYSVLQFDFINQVNNPPKLYFIEKAVK